MLIRDDILVFNDDFYAIAHTLPKARLVFLDVPYGNRNQTEITWDIPVDLVNLWKHIRLINATDSTYIFTASQPFSSKVILSNELEYKEELIWHKSKAPNYMQAKRRHLKEHEQVIIFSSGLHIYNPQMTQGSPYKARPGKKVSEVIPNRSDIMYRNGSNDGLRYPRSIIYFPTAESEGKVIHPTQKPVELLKYLILTYTNSGDTVIDPMMGSGTTCLAALLTGRKCVGIEGNKVYFDAAVERIRSASVSSQEPF